MTTQKKIERQKSSDKIMAGAIATTTSIFGCSSTCRTISTPPFSSRNPLQLHRIRPRLQLQIFPSLARTLNPAVKASVGSVDYVAEPATDVKFQSEINLPGCSGPLALLGTGYREKVFAIIGVKVYAAGFYVTNSINSLLEAWKGNSASQIDEDHTIFTSLYESNSEKSLQIVLVRDVDGKTFWDALDEAISPRIKQPTSIDETALSLFRNTFQDRPLKKGTFIFLTWVDPYKMLVCISSDGLPTSIDATIESPNVASALFDVFLGETPVSPTLKASVANGLAELLK